MDRRLRLGIVNQETWGFFQDIYEVLQAKYSTSVFRFAAVHTPFFRERVNRYLLRRALTRFLRQNDVVFFEWASELLVRASHLPKTCAIVTRLHRYEMYKWIDLVNWENVDKIIFVSEAKRNEFLEKYPYLAPRTVTISPSTSLDRFSFYPDKIFSGMLGTLCHLTPRKRVYDLILAFHEMRKEFPDLHLHIGGGEHSAHRDYYRALKNLVKQLNLSTNVTFHGHVTDTPNWYRQLDIFVSNSYSEGLQVAPMEAMATGCYVLSHHWEGAEELVPEECLFYSCQDLLRKVRSYIGLPKSAKLAKRAEMRFWAEEHFDIDKTIGEICACIDEVTVV